MAKEKELGRLVIAGEFEPQDDVIGFIRKKESGVLCPIEFSGCPEMAEKMHVGGISTCGKVYAKCPVYISLTNGVNR